MNWGYFVTVLVFMNAPISIVMIARYGPRVIRRMKPKPCAHQNIRCIHANEILATAKGWRHPKFARTMCLDCNHPLYDVPMPEMCYVTKREHNFVRTQRNQRAA